MRGMPVLPRDLYLVAYRRFIRLLLGQVILSSSGEAMFECRFRQCQKWILHFRNDRCQHAYYRALILEQIPSR